MGGDSLLPESVIALCNNTILSPLEVAQGNVTGYAFITKYLADGLPKQDDDTLRDAREYIDELLAVCEQRKKPMTVDKLLADADLVESASNSAVYLEYRTCGDETCSYMSDGEKHGAYKYRTYCDGDTVRREYLGKAKVNDD